MPTDANAIEVEGLELSYGKVRDLRGVDFSVPAGLFLDEPTTGLDPTSRLPLWRTIEAQVDRGTTVLLTTQYLDAADRLASRITVIDHGRVIAEGTSVELKRRVGAEREGRRWLRDAGVRDLRHSRRGAPQPAADHART